MFLDSDDSTVGGSGSGGARLRASIPTGHGSDPFACPCCANVFSEVLRLADVDLGLHAASLEKRSPVLPSSALISNARILTMNEAEPTAEAARRSGGRRPAMRRSRWTPLGSQTRLGGPVPRMPTSPSAPGTMRSRPGASSRPRSDPLRKGAALKMNPRCSASMRARQLLQRQAGRVGGAGAAT